VCREVNPRVRTHRAIFASINPRYGRASPSSNILEVFH